MQFKKAQTFDIDRIPTFEYGILVLKGEVKVNGVSYKADELAVEYWNNGHSRFGDINLEGTMLKRLVAPKIPSKLQA